MKRGYEYHPHAEHERYRPVEHERYQHATERHHRPEHEHYRYRHEERWHPEHRYPEHDWGSHEHERPRRDHGCYPLLEVLDRFWEFAEDTRKVGQHFLDCFTECLPLPCPPLPVRLPCLPRLSDCLPRDRKWGCEIPPPCWTPQPLEGVTCHICPGETATLRLRISNCGAAKREITIQATGSGATVNPASLTLGPMEHGFSMVSVAMPADADWGQEREILVWIRGCRDHFLRWTIRVSRYEDRACGEVAIEDCPDLVHHWYDHFYCERPCSHY